MSLASTLLAAVVTSTGATATPLVTWDVPARRPPSFALVIGNNHPLPNSDYAVLNYADDDALRIASYLESLGTRVYLLTSVDQETSERFGAAVHRARTPTRAMVESTLDEIEIAMQAVEGDEPELYFYFSGHGTITAAEAYLHLADAPFSRLDLSSLVLHRLPAYRKHVIIDSCHSYFLVNARGERVPAALTDDTLERHPNTGFLLSTSAKEEVQEWSGYQAGVFSYQVLGALQGAADVDGDGVVTYAEVHGYLVAANLAVDNAKVRIQPYVRRPLVRGTSLVDLRSVGPERRLHVPEEMAGHFFITDAAGRRVLDANKPPGAALTLVSERDRDLYLFANNASFAVERRTDGLVLGAALPDESQSLASRGPLADELRRSLFKRPLTQEFVAGVEAMALRAPQVQVDPRLVPPAEWYEDGATLGLLGSGVAVTAGGVVLAILTANATAIANERPITERTIDAREDAVRYRVGAASALSVGGVALLVGVLRAIITNEAFTERAGP